MAVDFLFDFNSPYAYLSAVRIADVMPVEVRWRPIAFGALIGQIGKVPWSLSDPESVRAGKAECERRAAELGLPPLRWGEGWPDENYSLLVLRAAVVADRAGRLPAFALAAFRQNFEHARALRDLDVVLDAAREADVDEHLVRAGVEDSAVKAELRARTDAAIAEGVTGIPTFVLPGGTLIHGDDRLEEAARAAKS